ncbi:MAG: hypothetical protein V3R80_07785, partial [Candidatus Tectomicrobia bacterium]
YISPHAAIFRTSLPAWDVTQELGEMDEKTWARLCQQIEMRAAQYVCGMIDEEILTRSVARLIGYVRHANFLVMRRARFVETCSLELRPMQPSTG